MKVCFALMALVLGVPVQARDVGKYVEGMKEDDKIVVRWDTIDRELAPEGTSIYYSKIAILHGQRHKLKGYFSPATTLHTSPKFEVTSDGVQKIGKTFSFTGKQLREVIEREKIDIPTLGLTLMIKVYRDTGYFEDAFEGGKWIDMEMFISANKTENFRFGGLDESGESTFTVQLQRAEQN